MGSVHPDQLAMTASPRSKPRVASQRSGEGGGELVALGRSAYRVAEVPRIEVIQRDGNRKLNKLGLGAVLQGIGKALDALALLGSVDVGHDVEEPARRRREHALGKEPSTAPVVEIDRAIRARTLDTVIGNERNALALDHLDALALGSTLSLPRKMIPSTRPSR